VTKPAFKDPSHNGNRCRVTPATSVERTGQAENMQGSLNAGSSRGCEERLLPKVSQEQILRNAHRLLRRTAYYRTGFVPLWSMVSDLTAHGSTYSTRICRELGWNPEANARELLPPRKAAA
jgi:hypothetical protein